MSEHLPITLERLAELQARLDEGAPMPEVLAEEGLSEPLWRSAQRGWLSLMGEEAARKRYALSQRYQQAYLAARPSLRGAVATKPEVEEEDALGATSADGLVLDLGLGVALPFAAADGKAPPRLIPTDPAPHSARAGDTLDGAPPRSAPDDPLNATTAGAITFNQLGVGALPFRPAGDEPPPSSTLDHDGSAPPPSVLPFSQPRPAPPARSPQPSWPEPAPPPPPAPRPAPPPPPARRPDPLPAASRSAVNRTGTLDEEAPIEFDDVLPFSKRGGPAPAPIADALPPRPDDPLNQTTEGVVLSPLLFATPFAKTEAPLPELTLDQYASLCAERRVMPAEQAAIAQRYGLASVADLERLDARWRRRFDAGAAERAAFTERLAEFEAWLRRRR